MNMKSLVVLLKVLYAGVLADAARAYPAEANGFARDYKRVEAIINRREIKFFTIFLPTFAKHLTRCLDDGKFTPFVGPHMGTKRGVVYPVLFSGLTKQLFGENGDLNEVTDSTPVLILQTLLSGAKKLRLECDDATVSSTVQSFVDTEEGVRPHSLNWGDVVLRHDHRLSIVGDEASAGESEAGSLFAEPMACDPALLSSYRRIQSVADRVFAQFGSPFDRDLRPRHGPGAIADRRECPSKYQFHSWPAKLEYCFPADIFGQPNGKLGVHAALVESQSRFFQMEEPEDHDVREVARFRDVSVASKLVAVPKTQKGPRLIAAEPSANMWMQQALLGFLVEAVGKSPLAACVDFKDQRKSGQLALKASLTKSHSTIDLSDASDRLSCWLVERLFRSNFDLLQSFNAVRTDVVSIPREMGSQFPRLTRLKKFATQGSALTFPVQTVVYAVIAIGAVLDVHQKAVNAKTIRWAAEQVRIFGDDIIVPGDSTGRVIECLTALGFKVNTAKTYTRGNFRESCGVDGYMGQDVTPAYVLEAYDATSPSSVTSLVECSNNFYMKGLWVTAELLQLTIPEDIRKRIPIVECKQDENGEWYRAGAFGFISLVGDSFGGNNYRWNEKLHLLEVKLLQPHSEVEKSEIRGDFALFQYFTEVPHLSEPEKARYAGKPETNFSMWSPGEARRPKLTMKLRWVPAEKLVAATTLPMMNR